MATDNFKVRRNEFHSVRNEELLRTNAELTLKLLAAESNIRSLELEISQLTGGRSTHTVKLQESFNGVARL